MSPIFLLIHVKFYFFQASPIKSYKLNKIPIFSYIHEKFKKYLKIQINV